MVTCKMRSEIETKPKRFGQFRFDLFRFVSISFRFCKFRFVSIYFVSFRFDFVSHFTGTPVRRALTVRPVMLLLVFFFSSSK